MQAYTGLKTLYLQQNAISEIENLHMLRELRTLSLGQNIISNIQGLECLTNLENLDLSQNCIEKVEGLSCLPKLKNLNLSGNRMKSVEDIRDLVQCTALTSLDVSSCRQVQVYHDRKAGMITQCFWWFLEEVGRWENGWCTICYRPGTGAYMCPIQHFHVD